MSISTKPASGFRDFLPNEMRQRQHVFHIIREVYKAHGFEELDTPCFERLDTLLGKYGDEGDQLMFKVLQRGRKLEKALNLDEPKDTDLADMGLRYDLTVPLARIYAQYKNELPRYFKRYQISPVWRADRPQKGRYREFYQCDVDIVGSSSMTCEAEVTSALAMVLKKLDFSGATIQVNHRMLLRAFIEAADIDVSLETDTLVAIDKLDKIGIDGVTKELLERGITQESIDKLLPMLDITVDVDDQGMPDNLAALNALGEKIGHLESGQQALKDLGELFTLGQYTAAATMLRLDPYLARGLSYYTGPIFEIRSSDFSGSLGGGGRYDGLIGMFGKESVPACGFSLGIERILVLLEERQQLQQVKPPVDVLITLWSQDARPTCLKLAQKLREDGIKVDLYPDLDKYKKQFKYADERDIPFVILLGKDEIAQDFIGIKNLKTGEQETVAYDKVVEIIKGKDK